MLCLLAPALLRALLRADPLPLSYAHVRARRAQVQGRESFWRRSSAVAATSGSIRMLSERFRERSRSTRTDADPPRKWSRATRTGADLPQKWSRATRTGADLPQKWSRATRTPSERSCAKHRGRRREAPPQCISPVRRPQCGLGRSAPITITYISFRRESVEFKAVGVSLQVRGRRGYRGAVIQTGWVQAMRWALSVTRTRT